MSWSFTMPIWGKLSKYLLNWATFVSTPAAIELCACSVCTLNKKIECKHEILLNTQLKCIQNGLESIINLLLFGELRGKRGSFHLGGFKKPHRQFQLKHTCQGPPVSRQTHTSPRGLHTMLGVWGNSSPALHLCPPPSLPTSQDKIQTRNTCQMPHLTRDFFTQSSLSAMDRVWPCAHCMGTGDMELGKTGLCTTILTTKCLKWSVIQCEWIYTSSNNAKTWDMTEMQKTWINEVQNQTTS